MSPQTRAALGITSSFGPPGVVPSSAGAPGSLRAASSQGAPATSDPPPESLAELTVTLRVQRAMALRTMAVLLGGLILLPGLLSVPWILHPLETVRLLGVPLLWLLLGLAAYPALYLLADWHERHADRSEGALAQREKQLRARRADSPDGRRRDGRRLPDPSI